MADREEKEMTVRSWKLSHSKRTSREQMIDDKDDKNDSMGGGGGG